MRRVLHIRVQSENRGSNLQQYINKSDIVMNSKLDYFQPGLRTVGFNNLFDD